MIILWAISWFGKQVRDEFVTDELCSNNSPMRIQRWKSEVAVHCVGGGSVGPFGWRTQRDGVVIGWCRVRAPVMNRGQRERVT